MSCGCSAGAPRLGIGQPSWRCSGRSASTTVLNNVVEVSQIQTPTEVDHYQIQRAVDIYVTSAGEDLERVTQAIHNILVKANIPRTSA